MSYLANKLHVQADHYKIGERLIETIETAKIKQVEREIIQKCYYANHHKLDKNFGFSRALNTTNLSVEKTLVINDVLRKAGCAHLFHTSYDPQCDIMKDEEARE